MEKSPHYVFLQHNYIFCCLAVWEREKWQCEDTVLLMAWGLDSLKCIRFWSFQHFFLRTSKIFSSTPATFMHRKVESSSMSWLVARLRIFRLFMKGKFDAYIMWPLDKKIQNFLLVYWKKTNPPLSLLILLLYPLY